MRNGTSALSIINKWEIEAIKNEAERERAERENAEHIMELLGRISRQLDDLIKLIS